MVYLIYHTHKRKNDTKLPCNGDGSHQFYNEPTLIGLLDLLGWVNFAVAIREKYEEYQLHQTQFIKWSR